MELKSGLKTNSQGSHWSKEEPATVFFNLYDFKLWSKYLVQYHIQVLNLVLITEAISFAESNSKCRYSLLLLKLCNCRVLSHKIAIYVSNYCQKASQRRTRKVQESEDTKESSEMSSIAQDKYITVMTSAVRIACTLFTLSHINTQSWMGHVFMGPKSLLGSYWLSVDAA